MSSSRYVILVLTFLGHSASKVLIQNSFYLMGTPMPSLPHRVSSTELQQLNEVVNKDYQRTVTEIKYKIKRLKADYHQERRRRNRSGAGGGSKFIFFDEMDAILSARPISSGGGSFSSIPPRNEETDVQNGRLH